MRICHASCAGQASGRATSSVQWGAWGGSGMATRVRGFMDRMARMGLGVLQPAQGLGVIGRVLAAAASPLQTQPPRSPVLVGACTGQPQSAWPYSYLVSARQQHPVHALICVYQRHLRACDCPTSCGTT